VGIGIIQGEYLPPSAAENPVKNDPRIERRHARCVKWVATASVDLHDATFFGIDTVTSLSLHKLNKIRNAYQKQHPDVAKKLNQLFDGISDDNDESPDDENLASVEEDLIEQTRSTLRGSKTDANERSLPSFAVGGSRNSESGCWWPTSAGAR